MVMVSVSGAGRAEHEEAERLAGERAALRRVAALAARAAAPGEVFAAVAEEAGHVLPEADFTMVGRYGAGRAVEPVGGWSRAGSHWLPGCLPEPGGRNVGTLVFETGRPGLVGDLAGGGGAVSAATDRTGVRSAAGAPVSVEGRLWGVVIAASARENALPPGSEHRLAAFTELAAAAIAGAQARAELTASRARIAATADETRRRIERDLHDGAQQRLVSLALQLRTAQAGVPPELGKLRAGLERVVAGLAGMLDELREYARGIHPAILAEGGLAPALQTLARRSPVPVTLGVHLAGRLPERAEVTAYYVVSEALANAAKHAGASAVHVGVEAAGDVVRLAVRDNGAGGADPARGSGLAGLKDRVEAIGGTLSVRSRPGEGTALLAELPGRPGNHPWLTSPEGEAVTLAGQGAPDGRNGDGARARVPQSRKPPGSAPLARPARLRPARGTAPARAPFRPLSRGAARTRDSRPGPALHRPSRPRPLHNCGSQRKRSASSFVLEELDWGGESAEAHRRHAECVRDMAESAEPQLLVPAERDYWMEQLGRARGNVRAALAWSLSADGVLAVGVDLAGALGRFWLMSGQLAGAGSWYAALLAQRGEADTTLAWAKVLYSG